jgi:hypothetical protein
MVLQEIRVGKNSSGEILSPTGGGFYNSSQNVRRKQIPLTRPSATLSPSDGERDGVRGVLPADRFRILFAVRSRFNQVVAGGWKGMI